MTKKEICKRLNLWQPWLLDQWIVCGKLRPVPEKDKSGKRIYTEEHAKIAKLLLVGKY